MNTTHASILQWIDGQASAMTRRLIEWANMNTGSHNQVGLDRFRAIVAPEFASLGAQVSEPALNISGYALAAIKRPAARLRVFLCIHMDTVYAIDHPFQSCTKLDDKKLQGPGVADAKGGLVVMLTALAALEQSPLADKIGWEVLINPDEEIGSLGSAPLLAAAAGRNRVGLLFEPATADGALIDRRKGSGNFAIVIRGKSAHAGRDFTLGRNAVVAAARAAAALHELNREMEGVNVNVALIEGGGPSNVVPDLAKVRFGVRTSVPEDEARVLSRLHQITAAAASEGGYISELTGQFHSPPKIPDARARELMALIERCGAELNLPIRWKASGGACDGNKLAAAGLPNIDTLGPCGGNLHSQQEFVLLDTLVERTKLAALVLLRLAEGAE